MDKSLKASLSGQFEGNPTNSCLAHKLWWPVNLTWFYWGGSGSTCRKSLHEGGRIHTSSLWAGLQEANIPYQLSESVPYQVHLPASWAGHVPQLKGIKNTQGWKNGYFTLFDQVNVSWVATHWKLLACRRTENLKSINKLGDVNYRIPLVDSKNH